MIIPREYQKTAAQIAATFFHGPARNPVFQVIPSGAGKSVIIANTVKELSGQTVVLQPSSVILEQNYQKYVDYGYRAGIYSASAGHRYVDNVTFATIGSIINKKHLFKNLRNIIFDECHFAVPGGQYGEFIAAFPKAKCLGLTATPYRLTANREGAILEFLNRPYHKIFHSLVYYVQNDVLYDAGYLADINYVNNTLVDRSRLVMNDSGTDFTDSSVRALYREIDMPRLTAMKANELLEQRKNLLGFCTLVSEAETVSKMVPKSAVLSADTLLPQRTKILRAFKEGELKAVFNCNILVTGYDYPELETVLDASATMSLARYYQKVCRGSRIHPKKKDCHYVDLAGNHSFFGDVEDMKIKVDFQGNYDIWNKNKRLTGVNFTKK